MLPRFSIEANWYKIKIDGAIQPVDARVHGTQCVVQTNDPAACALVTARSMAS